MESLLLFRRALSSPTMCRFIPALSVHAFPPFISCNSCVALAYPIHLQKVLRSSQLRSEQTVLLREACLPQLAAYGAENLIILRQCFHLMSEAADPKRLQASLLCDDAIFDARDVFLPKA